MNEKLAKIFDDFCKVKDQLNTENVNEETVDIIGRFGKAIKNAETIVLDPPKIDRSFQDQFKASTYMPISEKEIKGIELKLKEPKIPAAPKPPQARTIKGTVKKKK